MNWKILDKIENGSGYNGAVHISYKELRDKLGEPLGPSGDNKIKAQWSIQFEDGTKASIYDWKEYDTPLNKITEWHIGGKGSNDKIISKQVLYVHILFGQEREALKLIFEQRKY